MSLLILIYILAMKEEVLTTYLILILFPNVEYRLQNRPKYPNCLTILVLVKYHHIFFLKDC